MGRFLLGSTVVLLWPQNTVDFNNAWAPGGAVRLGEAMAHCPQAPVAVPVPVPLLA
jgi:phosphatidylserine decarboxylase